ncbi:biopolymer transporter ExbD [Kovacikia minuta CCNUW1]|uniref:ExbD/TolR family protein n=1 Tax=Kovacikia minuta TaxID=2931930 RepID=UPI001CCE2DC2|nr:biopolymer transporter ExbD [Kovacikia minuta]UBF25392.1 biopolymer transporter ExbD [Kovacikia minuta CCNUW1]
MKINLDTPIDEVQIQIIPLIDVIFCILTFFILAALQLTRQQAINVDLPKASTGATQMQDTLVVSINSTGQTFVDKQFVDRNQLAQTLQEYRAKNPNGLLVLYASQTAFYNDVVQVLDLMRQVGGDRVALATLPLQPNQAPGASPVPTINPTTSPLSPFSSPSPAPTSTLNPGQYQIPPATGQSPSIFGSPATTPTPSTVP